MSEASKSNVDDEEALKNGDVHSNPVRALDALTENNDGQPSVVGARLVFGSSH